MSEGFPPPPEAEIHSFIVKLWREPPGWGGHITHVPSHARRSVRDIDDIAAFISKYLVPAATIERRIDRRTGDGT